MKKKQPITDRIHARMSKKDRKGILTYHPPGLMARVDRARRKMKPVPTMQDIIAAGLEDFAAEHEEK